MTSNLLAEAAQRVPTQLEQLERDRASLQAFGKLIRLGFSETELHMMGRGYQIWSQLQHNRPPTAATPATGALTVSDSMALLCDQVRVLFPAATVCFATVAKPAGPQAEVVIYTGIPRSAMTSQVVELPPTEVLP